MKKPVGRPKKLERNKRKTIHACVSAETYKYLTSLKQPIGQVLDTLIETWLHEVKK